MTVAPRRRLFTFFTIVGGLITTIALLLLIVFGLRCACGQDSVPARTILEIDFERSFVELAVCPKPDAQPVAGLRVDATMPEHRHGMNYRPSVRQVSPGRWRAEGLMFHMPGRWEFVFQPHDGRREDRLTVSEDVR